MQRFKKNLFFFLRITIAVASLAYLYHITNWPQFFQEVQKADIYYLFLAFLSYFVIVLVQGTRFLFSFHLLNWPVRSLPFIIHNYFSLFADLYIPGKVGSDLYRFYLLKHFDKKTLVSLLIFVRLQLLYILVLWSAVTLPFYQKIGDLLPPYTHVAGIVLLIIITFITIRLLKRVQKTVQAPRLLRHMIELFHHIGAFSNNLRFIASTLFMTILMVVASIVVYILVAKAFSIPVTTTDLILTVPFLMFVFALPVTIHGRGVGEIAAIYIWQLAGLSIEQSVLLSLGVYTIFLAHLIFSGCCWGVFGNRVHVSKK